MQVIVTEAADLVFAVKCVPGAGARAASAHGDNEKLLDQVRTGPAGTLAMRVCQPPRRHARLVRAGRHGRSGRRPSTRRLVCVAVAGGAARELVDEVAITEKGGRGSRE